MTVIRRNSFSVAWCLTLESSSSIHDRTADLASLCLLPPRTCVSIIAGVGLLGYGFWTSLYGYVICSSQTHVTTHVPLVLHYHPRIVHTCLGTSPVVAPNIHKIYRQSESIFHILLSCFFLF